MNQTQQPARPPSALRQRAQEAARERFAGAAQAAQPGSTQDAKPVLDELRVYQIELEMQNDELRRALAELDQSQSRYFDLYDLAPVGYCTISESGLLIEANLTASTLLGVPHAELLHRPIARFVEAQDQAAYQQHRDRVLQDAQSQSFELRMISAGRSTFWAHLDAIAARGNDGEAVLRIAISDISARKKMELELVSALAAAEVANRAKDVFINNMSHEFRTPMNIILGFCEILQRKLNDPKQKLWVASIKQAANQLLAILNNILEFSELQAGQLDLHGCAFNLRAFTQQAVAHPRQLAIAKGLAFHVAVDAAVPETLNVDRERLKLVMDNLLDNALKFTASGSISVHAGVAQRKPDQALLRIEIQDTGTGIDDATQKLIFAPFVQGDSSSTRTIGGAGIGLSISQRLVRLMGGEIGVSSQPGAGSTFWFTVPLAHGAQTGS